ncbi:MAG: metallophosphoesterase [Asgard group archaeon]|nr:metallophosphoesterase [Asgard group archaeon]
MKIGIMSDSHDNLNNIKKAIQIFKKQGVEVILHAGDLISPFCIPLFEEFSGRFFLCAGNNLGDTKFLESLIEGIGKYYSEIGEIDLDNITFALYHGTHEPIISALFNSENYDYIITGHTHHKEVKEKGKTILINPGETFGDLYGTATIAILDTENRKVDFHELI